MGFKVRYSGSDKPLCCELLERWQQEQRLVVHCPELAAGLPVPRPPAEIQGVDGNDVMQGNATISENTGQDVTAHYQLAARLALQAAQESGCSAALLTDGSPTCGSRFIYDGTFRGVRKAGMGVAASLLAAHGIAVFSDTELEKLAAWIAAREAACNFTG